MDDSKKLEVALQLRDLADANFRDWKLGDAYFYYMNCIKMCPSWEADLKERFFVVLSCWGQLLEQRCNYQEIFTIYEEALKIYPDCAELYNNLGAHLLRLNIANQAIYHFKMALLKDANCFSAYRNLHSAYCAMVERWHYRMLNDTCRNDAYRLAITKKINQGFDSVFDIGTGTGLFCLYAHQAGASKIHACDYSEAMISVAQEVFLKNGLSNTVKLTNKLSNNIRIPQDLPERVSLVVTETLDSCLLGEHILYTLDHAWKYLLKPPLPQPTFLSGELLTQSDAAAAATRSHGMVIPHSGILRLRLLQSQTLAKQYMFPLIDVYAEECAAALASISLNESAEVSAPFNNLNFCGVILRTSLNEPYDTERLQDLPDCEFLSEPHPLLHINFNDPAQIQNYLSSRNRLVFEVTCVRGGYLHAMGAWFDIQLDESIWVSSAPDDGNAENCCWDQAVFPCTKPHRVIAGSKVTVMSDWTEGKVTLEVKQIAHPDGVATVELTESLPPSAPSGCVTLLNDDALVVHLKSAAIKFAQGFRHRSLKIMDLFAIPVFGLSVLRNICLPEATRDDVELVCVVSSPTGEAAIRSVAQLNSIPLACLSVVKTDDFDEAINSQQQWEQHFDVILVDFLDSEGVLNEEAVCRINSLKSLLKPDGVFLPKKIVINGQLIHSTSVERSMRIVDEDILRYGIGECVNQFQVPQLLDVNVASLKYENFSYPFPCCAFVPDNLDSEFHDNFVIPAMRNGTINSILCWFSISILDDQMYYSTLHKLSYVHQTAFLPSIPIVVQRNDYIMVDLVYHHGGFLINLKKCDINA